MLIAVMDHVVRNFQVVQRADGSVVMRVVPRTGDRLPDEEYRVLHDIAAKYLRGTWFAIEYVEEIPLTSTGKREVVIVEPQAGDAGMLA